jgi:cbb3-type cytochrome oxidase subunit 3
MPFEDLVSVTRVIGLVVFLALFVGMLVWVFRPGSRRVYEADAQLPFVDDTPRGTDRHG